ncbi:hypothetical protein K7X08_033260 [Anisodus acutangulus]|uniref:Pistil-specific extensin-like protein n=1 Tax=Anisodus acutangulus TaxID=402998 RepID=A0A9Q1M1P9_9SOLA|nr:hypothetical protein K7X08_033260 [Anisodus acutangulus]
MSFVPTKSLGFILALVLLTSFTVLGQNVDGIVTSELAPHNSLVSFPPVESPKAHKGVRGVVYCKSCKYRGVDTLLGASPIQGAVVKLACNNTKYHLTSLATTDKNGYFFIEPKWLTTAGYHKCKVFLAKSPKQECSVPTNFHNGQTGAMLIPAPPSPMSPKPVNTTEPGVKLFNVGPFAFEPSKNQPCKTK